VNEHHRSIKHELKGVCVGMCGCTCISGWENGRRAGQQPQSPKNIQIKASVSSGHSSSHRDIKYANREVERGSKTSRNALKCGTDGTESISESRYVLDSEGDGCVTTWVCDFFGLSFGNGRLFSGAGFTYNPQADDKDPDALSKRVGESSMEEMDCKKMHGGNDRIEGGFSTMQAGEMRRGAEDNMFVT